MANPTRRIAVDARVRAYADPVLRGVPNFLALTLVAASVFGSGCGIGANDQTNRPSPSDQPVVTGEPAGYNASDVAFADSMVTSDLQAADLSASVAAHSTNSAILAFATANMAQRQSDVLILRALRVQWQENPDTKSDGEGSDAARPRILDPGALAKLNSLRNNQFDELWLQDMIDLDRGAIDLSNAEISSGKNIDAVGIAKRLPQARMSEIAQLSRLSAP